MAVRLSEALDIMRSPDKDGNPRTFDLSFYTFNSRKGAGGNRKDLKNVRLMERKEAFQPKKQTSKKPGIRFQSKHILIETSEKQKIQVHKRLICEFNGQIVHY